MDLIWDESLDLGADAQQMDLFLGSGRYDPILEHVFRGLGILAHLLKPETSPCPPTSTGSPPPPSS